MVKKRLIPCLDVAGGRVVKGVRFVGLRELGDPVELASRYSELGADELVFLDITATIEGRGPMLDLVSRAAAELEIPFTVGGGVAGLEDARALLRAGADKVPVIASGGAGCAEHLAEAFAAGAEAALVASIVHEDPERLPRLKAELEEAGWPVRR